MKAVICFGIATAIAAGCKGGDPDAKAGAGSGTGTGPAPADAAALVVPQLPKAVDPAAVEAVIAAWLDAQNRGAFDAYEALYAARMEGVKRVGTRATTFDRAGWMADRKRMFRHPMTVAVRELKISTVLDSAAVDFVQVFTQGKFRDEGTKRIVLVSEGGGLRIAREEMLGSALLPSARGSLGATGVRMVIELDGTRYAVLHGSPDAAWGGPDATLVLDNGLMIATRPAIALPPDLAAWRRQGIRAFTAEGEPCVAAVTELLLASGGTPQARTVEAWRGDPATGQPALTPAERAAAVFALSQPFLLGRLLAPGCAPAVVIDAGAPTFYRPVAADPPTERAIGDALRNLPDFDQIQRRFVDEHGGTGPWLAVPEVRVFTDGSKRYAVAAGRAGEGCGEFEGAIWALFEVAGGPPRRVASLPRQAYTTEVLFDSDGDGDLEMIATEPVPGNFAVYAEMSPQGMRAGSAVTFPSLDLGCARTAYPTP